MLFFTYSNKLHLNLKLCKFKNIQHLIDKRYEHNLHRKNDLIQKKLIGNSYIH